MLRILALFAAALTVVANDQDMYCDVPDEQLYVYRVPKHNCKCNKDSEGTLRYFNKKLQICNGEVFVDVGSSFPPTQAPTKPPTPKPTTLKPTTKPTPKPTPKPTTKPPPIGDKTNPGMTCNQVFSIRSGAVDGYYYLKNGATVTKTYCYMSGHICGSRGWTLIMKINGRSGVFNYDSSQWRSRTAYNPSSGASSALGQQETKLESYWTYKFSRLCLGMRVGGSLRWLTVNYNARATLYDVIAPGHYRRFHVGRHAWKNLVPGSSLQRNCNREGFNNVGERSHSKARIGIIANQEGDCNSVDSRIGFGTGGGNCGENRGNSAGNEARCSPDNGDKSIFGFGYIFAQ